ncbi:rab-GTPase-TBC domain-containing protein [Suillus fuscotomentosus]|uniref:Rab-GTPase-TBC domain-containing protein n=1 Tax=Suillus fuscotomentosus TaxID=1912939 RepID=A0AAD4EE79_9AGAM|nr:rab-GTPase-TBC domain-containing protein [Suillus fuscotomentosus]KAG1904536.1 rab-GTPase-TBC domain-containing protein [Suillus fuscotomentosus]
METPSSSTTLALPKQSLSRRYPRLSPSSTASSVPELYSSSSTDRERSSTESAIFTIYSMYGDDEEQTSWTASSTFEDPSKELDLSLGDSFNYSNFFNHRTSYVSNTDTTFIDLSTDMKPFGTLSNPHDRTPLSATSNGSANSSYPLPLSNHANSHGRDTLELPTRSKRVPPIPTRSQSALTSCSSSSDLDAVSPPVSHLTPPHNHPPSSLLRSKERHVPEPTLVLTPLQPTSFLISPSSQTPSSSPTTKQQSKLSSPSSKTSLVPSEGEDVDAFHVRSTYAHLDATGVRGDGYEEGVERTRARIRASKGSELRAEAALAGPSEKSRDLEARELSVLSSLDRYGFFIVPSHDRLVLLPSGPLVKRLTSVRAGSKSAPSHAVSVSSLPAASSPLKEQMRVAKWDRMLEVLSRDGGGNVESWGIKASKAHKLRQRVYKGIPDRWRRAAWEVLMSRFSKSGRKSIEKLGNHYSQDLEKPSSYDVQIDLDVPRTISGHIMFHTRYGLGQRCLFHVLHSFSLRCHQCGYVQGMGPIAATLLCYFEPEKVYAALSRLHDNYNMHTIFAPGFPGLLQAIYVQERIMESKMPDVYAAFKKHMISTTSYATKWYITLFANSVPFQTQLRLWDAYLLEGEDLFVAVAISIVWVYRDHITSSSANFETILSLLSSFFVPEDDDSLLSWIERMLGDKKLRLQMAQWRQDWVELVASGKDSEALL